MDGGLDMTEYDLEVVSEVHSEAVEDEVLVEGLWASMTERQRSN